MSKLKVFECFAGIGCQHMALEETGIDYEIVGIAEYDEKVYNCYKILHGDKIKNYGDVTLINPNELPNFDLFTYSFPCQDLSKGGKREGLKGKRSSMLYECKKIIDNKLPKYLVMENVVDLLNKNNKDAFEDWIQYLTDLGYTSYYKRINSLYYGVPQRRERLFMVSILNDTEGFEFTECNNVVPLRSILEDEVEEKWYKELEYEIVNKKNVIAMFKRGGYEANNRIQNINLSMNTLTTADRGTEHILLDNGRVRRITPLERCRLMGFSDSVYHKLKENKISDTQIVYVTGNSIVKNVLVQIFKDMFIKE